MKIQKKVYILILIFLSIILSSCKVLATDFSGNFKEAEFSEEYQKYLELDEEEKKKIIMPRSYEIQKTEKSVTNPLVLPLMLRSTLSQSYSLRDYIPENLVIKDQQQTNSCWTFASLASLETNLALKDYKNGITPILYDFSERHMEYSTSRIFANNQTNTIGFNRMVGSGGHLYFYIPYLTNGTGAINETEMPFENNEDTIELSKIQNKNVVTQVNDIAVFPSYSVADDKTQIMQQMKEHITNYGGISAAIHGAQLTSSAYNNETGAIYCNNITTYPANHAVTIIGWDDNYSIENFFEANRPKNSGAWIIKNSWGTELERFTLSEMKEYILKNYKTECEENNWTEANQIPDERAIEKFVKLGFTIDENNEAFFKIGDNGFMYVSYEDANIYRQLEGIVDAQNEVTYENIYQYDQYSPAYALGLSINSPISLASIFDRKTSGIEYLTQVSIYAPETYTCKIYVNPNGTSKKLEDLQHVPLKSGDTETIGTGYHTLEFENPVQINSGSFAVVFEIQGTQENTIQLSAEANPKNFKGTSTIWDYVTVESGKCFLSIDKISANNWYDTSTCNASTGGNWPNFDTTIKAFTTSKIFEKIEITTPPTKVLYVEGQDFDTTGMVVKAVYTNGEKEEITDYQILDGNKLSLGKTSVTISYEGKTTTQEIQVIENTVNSIAIKNVPTKVEYWVGEDFDATGMVIEATYEDGTKKEITDYKIEDGTNLKSGQKTVTISYENKTITQNITVKDDIVEKIEITIPATKVSYVEGQDFDATGMVVKATYTSGKVQDIIDYKIEDGENLSIGKTSVTISYEGKTVTQTIEVVENLVQTIKVKIAPIKTSYIEGQDFDVTGMIIEATYKDGTIKEITDYKVEDGTKLKKGQTTITISYGEIAITQAITVDEKSIESINIKKKPTKIEYIQNKDEIDLTEGIIELVYNNGDKEEILMTSEDVFVNGFNNKEVGKQTITLTYKSKNVQFSIEIKPEVKEEIKEEVKPENSKFNNITGNVKKIKIYEFTDTNSKDYTVFDVEIDNIVKSTENDKMEYYYYLSGNPQENDIVSWIKIDELKEADNKIMFEINSTKITNFENLGSADKIYLYIKEVSTKNNLKSENISSALELGVENIVIEEYINGEKKVEVDSETVIDKVAGDKLDSTVAQQELPKAGKNILMIFLIVALLFLGRVTYLKYKDIKIK